MRAEVDFEVGLICLDLQYVLVIPFLMIFKA